MNKLEANVKIVEGAELLENVERFPAEPAKRMHNEVTANDSELDVKNVEVGA